MTGLPLRFSVTQMRVGLLDDLFRAALRLTGNVTDAEDLTQDTCLRAFECLDQLRNSAAARLWVFTILRSIFLRRI